MFSQINKKNFILLLSTLGLAFVYFFPQLHHWKNGYEGANIIHIDELSYLARLERATQHKESLCNMWVIEKQGQPCLVPTFPERVLALPSYIFDVTSEKLIMIYRPLLASLGFLIFFIALRIQNLKFYPALLIGLSFYLLPAAWYLKPGLSLFKSIDIFAFNRFTNPLFSLCLFFLSWLFAYSAFSKSCKKTAWLAGIFLGLNFYISIFYWTHLCLAYLLAFFVFGKKTKSVFTTIVISSALVSAPYWLHVFSIMKHPAYENIAWRLGIFINDYGLFLAKNYALYPYLIVSLFLVLSQKTSEKWAGLSFLSGALCYLSPLVTGKEFQNFHYKYTLVPFAMLILYYCFKFIYSKAEDFIQVLETLRKSMGPILLAGFFLVAIVKIEKFSQNNAHFVSNPQIGAYQSAFTYLRNQIKKPSVIIASEEIMTMIPFKTGHYSFQDSGVEFSKNQEIYERNLVYWTLKYDKDAQALERKLTPELLSIPVWIHGFPQEVEDEFKERNFPTLDLPEQKRLASIVSAHFSKANLDKSEILQAQYQMDYVLLGPREEHLKKNITKFLDLEFIKDFKEVQLFRVLSD